LRQQLQTVADNTRTLADNSSKLAGGPARDAGLIEPHRQEWSLARQLAGQSAQAASPHLVQEGRRPQARFHCLFGAGGLIGRFCVEIVSFFGGC
jgi:hypothetical protein